MACPTSLRRKAQAATPGAQGARGAAKWRTTPSVARQPGQAARCDRRRPAHSRTPLTWRKCESASAGTVLLRHARSQPRCCGRAWALHVVHVAAAGCGFGRGCCSAPTTRLPKKAAGRDRSPSRLHAAMTCCLHQPPHARSQAQRFAQFAILWRAVGVGRAWGKGATRRAATTAWLWWGRSRPRDTGCFGRRRHTWPGTQPSCTTAGLTPCGQSKNSSIRFEDSRAKTRQRQLPARAPPRSNKHQGGHHRGTNHRCRKLDPRPAAPSRRTRTMLSAARGRAAGIGLRPARGSLHLASCVALHVARRCKAVMALQVGLSPLGRTADPLVTGGGRPGPTPDQQQQQQAGQAPGSPPMLSLGCAAYSVWGANTNVGKTLASAGLAHAATSLQVRL